MEAKKIADLLKDSNDLMDLLELDLKNTGEVGGILNNKGQINNIKLGDSSSVSLKISENETSIGIHTHPPLSGVEISERDIKSTNYPNIDGGIILCQEMFDTEWNGVSFVCEGGEIVDRFHFSIVCQGSTDGPAEERHISNPEFHL